MNTLPMVGAALAAGVVWAYAATAQAMQPPMNNFNDAFYTCENGAAFMISYDSDRPASATMTTSNDNKQYVLKRDTVSDGVQFSGDAAKFWTDGKKVRIEGAQTLLLDCQLKSH